jgi:hypothetical protein
MKPWERKCRLVVVLVLWGVLGLQTPLHAKSDSNIYERIGGVAWGTDLSELKDVDVLYKKGDVLYCVDRTRAYTVENFNLGYIIYGFYKDKLFSAHLKIAELDVYSVVRQKLIDTLGAPRVSVELNWEIYNWKDKALKVKLKRSQDAAKMKISFYYTPLSSQLSAGDRKQEDSIRFLPIEKGGEPNMIPLLRF